MEIITWDSLFDSFYLKDQCWIGKKLCVSMLVDCELHDCEVHANLVQGCTFTNCTLSLVGDGASLLCNRFHNSFVEVVGCNSVQIINNVFTLSHFSQMPTSGYGAKAAIHATVPFRWR